MYGALIGGQEGGRVLMAAMGLGARRTGPKNLAVSSDEVYLWPGHHVLVPAPICARSSTTGKKKSA